MQPDISIFCVGASKYEKKKKKTRSKAKKSNCFPYYELLEK